MAGCANDCPGVDPEAIIVGGGLVAAATAGALPAVAGAVGFGTLGLAAIGQMVGGAACPATRPCNVRLAVLDLQLNFLIADAVSKRPLSPSVLQTDRTRQWPTEVSSEVSLLNTCAFNNGLFRGITTTNLGKKMVM